MGKNLTSAQAKPGVLRNAVHLTQVNGIFDSPDEVREKVASIIAPGLHRATQIAAKAFRETCLQLRRAHGLRLPPQQRSCARVAEAMPRLPSLVERSAFAVLRLSPRAARHALSCGLLRVNQRMNPATQISVRCFVSRAIQEIGNE